MPGKPPSETSIEDHTYRIFPNDLNANGTVFGGLILATLDRVAAVIAERHSECTCVTVSVDAVHFLAPAGRGENLIFKASINRSWNTSMEIGVKVLAENNLGGLSRRHIVSAYLTFVALDSHQKPTKVPPVLPRTDEEKRRFEEAEIRRNHRSIHTEEMKKRRSAREKGKQ